MLMRITAWPRQAKSVLMLFSDTLLLPLALWTAVCLRLDIWVLPQGTQWWAYLLCVMIALPIFIRLGLYRAVVRYIEDRAIMTIAAAVSLSVVLFSGIIHFLNLPLIPRGALLIYWVLAVVYITLSRMLARGLLRRVTLSRSDCERVLIYGAGSSGLQLAVALRNGREYEPQAFVDDSPRLQGLVSAGLKIHAPEDVPELIRALDIQQIVLAMPSASRSRLAQIIQKMEALHIPIKSLPGMADLVSGKASYDQLREIDIEDLLGRDPVPPRVDLLSANIGGKVVLVTGAGGSIGSELCRQIAALSPKHLLLFELSEFALYSIHQELRQLAPTLAITPLLGSVTDYDRLLAVMTGFKVDTVYHAAAYKHVPMVEHNPVAGILNNAFGTQTCAQAAQAAGLATFVLISTDKAVRPTNVMGATKRLAELCLQALSDAGSRTRFVMVRFGNVLGSSGSVVPLFKQQIAAGGPVTLTHPDITRYFMTIPEAAQLVIQAGAMGEGGDVFVLDMGEPVKIIDLARRLVHLSGLEVKDSQQPNGDIEIRCTGLRPGEKLYEELLIGDNTLPTPHTRILRAQEHSLPLAALQAYMSRLKLACDELDAEQAFTLMQEVVQEFKPTAQTADWLVAANREDVAG